MGRAGSDNGNIKHQCSLPVYSQVFKIWDTRFTALANAEAEAQLLPDPLMALTHYDAAKRMNECNADCTKLQYCGTQQ